MRTRSTPSCSWSTSSGICTSPCTRATRRTRAATASRPSRQPPPGQERRADPPPRLGFRPINRQASEGPHARGPAGVSQGQTRELGPPSPFFWPRATPTATVMAGRSRRAMYSRTSMPSVPAPWWTSSSPRRGCGWRRCSTASSIRGASRRTWTGRQSRPRQRLSRWSGPGLRRRPRPPVSSSWGGKNSEVYHHPGCADAERIEPGNLVEYTVVPKGKRLHQGCPR